MRFRGQGIGLMVVPGNAASSASWSSYWTQQSEVLFFGEISKIRNGKLYNQKSGATDYLTVGGTAGSYTFQCPNTAAYIAADTDYIWFKPDTSLRTPTEAQLIGYDFTRTIIKYDDASPYSIRAIMILNTNISVGSLQNKMRNDFMLSIWWDNTLSAYGDLKGNRTTGKSVFPGDPTVPSDLALTVVNAITIQLDWNDTDGTIHIERSPTNESNYTEVHSLASGVKTWTDVSCSPSTKYYYRLRSSNSVGYSSYCTSANATTPAASTLLTNLKAYWKFDETTGNAIDVINSYALTNNGGLYGAGKINNCVDLGEGYTRYLQIDNDFGMSYNTPRSFSFWVNLNNYPTAGGEFCLLNMIFGTNPGNYTYLSYANVAGVKKLGIAMTHTYTVNLTPEVWQHIVITWDHTNNVSKVYHNGNLVITDTSFSGDYHTWVTSILLGKYLNNTKYAYVKYDEFGFWDKILSQDEVNELCNSGNANAYPFLG